MTELESPLADVSYGTRAGDGRGGDVRYPRPGRNQVAAAAASVLAWADDVGLVGEDYPKLMRYLKRLRARPAYAY